MEFIKNVLINYWPQILAVVLFIASFILHLLKKKPIKDMVSWLFEWCLEAISLAESSGVKGAEKLAVAVQYVLNRLKLNFPGIDLEEYRQGIVEMIEDILKTPQKHDI